MSMLTTWRHGNKKYHFVAEIKDGEVTVLVCKWWRASKQRWEYIAEEKSVLIQSHGFSE